MGASSTAENPSAITPSSAMRSPGLTMMTSPTATSSGPTSTTCGPRRTRAICGANDMRSRIELRVRASARDSSQPPSANRKTTVAASEYAPMPNAPTTAIIMSTFMSTL